MIMHMSKVIIGIAMITSLYSQSLIWQEEYPFDSPTNMICSDDGYVFITGQDQGYLYTMKINPDGDTVWTQRTELNPAYDENGHDLVYDEAKTYLYCIGHSYFNDYSGLYLVKYDYANGDTVYTEFMTFMTTEEAYWGVELYDNDSKLVVVGYFYHIFYAYEPTIVLINAADGGIIFSGYYLHGADVEASFWDIKTDNDGNFLVGGKYHEPFSSYPVVGFLIWKINSASLEWIWQKRNLRYQPDPIIYPYWEEGTEEIALDNEGNPVAVGCLVEDWEYFEPMYFMVLKHSNPNGDTLWHTNIGYNGKGVSCEVDYYQNVLVCGTLNDQGMVFYLDTLGAEIWDFPLGVIPERIRYYKSNDSLYFYVYSHNVDNVQVRKYFYHLIIGIEESQDVATNVNLQCYPNPFNKSTVISYSSLVGSTELTEVINDQLLLRPRGSQDRGAITNDLQCSALRIYDATGRLVKSFDLESSIEYQVSSITWYGDDDLGRAVPAGIYFVRLQTSEKTLTRKVIKIK